MPFKAGTTLVFFSFLFLSLLPQAFLSGPWKAVCGLWWFVLYLVLLLCSLLSSLQQPPTPLLASIVPHFAREKLLPGIRNSLLSKSPNPPGGPPESLPARGWGAGGGRGALGHPGLLPNTDKVTLLTHLEAESQNPRNTLGSVFVKENDTPAGRWYYWGKHFNVQFRMHILYTAGTEIIRLMCVCAVIWSGFR